MTEPLAQLMEQAWSSMDEVCSSLSPEQWDLPTECPGWSVKDQLAHVASIESGFLGRKRAAGEPIEAPWIRNPMGEINELELEKRRPLPPDEILAEYRDVTAERGKVLAEISPDEWEGETQGVLGKAPMRDVIAIRIVDVHFHEQDVRRATGRPGHMNGDVARLVFERMAAAMPFVVGKRAAAAEGETVVFAVGPPGETFAIQMSGKRAEPVQPVPTSPTVRLSMDCETFLRLAGGRWTLEKAESDGRLRIEGDRDLAGRVVSNMPITP